MIRILHSVSNMDRGGIETMLMNYYRHFDRNKIQFDFLCNKAKPGAYDDEIIRMGGRVFRAPSLNPLKFAGYLRYMTELFERYPGYRIIHVHNEALGVYALHAAKANGVPVRIFHAHNIRIAFDLKWPLKTFCLSRIPGECNVRWACGEDAARYYYGDAAVDDGDCMIIPNAIETERFIFSGETRRRIRREHGLENRTVIGHVGRFSHQKNHAFIIEIFERVHRMRRNAVLVLLGEGELQERIKKLVRKKGLASQVRFMGSVNNPHEWYQGFDAFLLPSRWEGLPLVGIEAQTAALPCVFSDKVPKEAGVTDRVSFLSLSVGPVKWAESLLRAIDGNKRIDMNESITEAGYNIHAAAIKLQTLYEEFGGK